MKRLMIFIGVIGLAASLGAQSLADLAKREKERRESFRGHHAVVINNRGLLLVKKVPAVEVTIPEGQAGEGMQSGDQGTLATDIPVEPGLTNPQDQAGAASALTPNTANLSGDITESDGPLEDQLRTVDAVIEELTTQINSLRQQYEAQNTMVPGYVIQQQIDETYQRLTRVQARQAKIREKMGPKAPPIK